MSVFNAYIANFCFFKRLCNLNETSMQSLAAASRPRLSETESKWFVFEISGFASLLCKSKSE